MKNDINENKALSQTSVSSSINSLLSKFDNGLELYRNNAIFSNCIEHLLRGGDIYKIFEQIIVMQSNTQEKLTELISSGVLRQEIIVSKDKFDELHNDFEPTIKHFRDENDTSSSNYDDRPIGGFGDW